MRLASNISAATRCRFNLQAKLCAYAGGCWTEMASAFQTPFWRYGRQTPRGRYATGNADGFARIATDADGAFHFETRKPGAVPYDGERMQAPHLLVLVFMRGLLRNLVTRMYFSGEAANAADPVLDLIPAEQRPTLIAQADKSVESKFLWDVRACCGPESAEIETAFFDW